MADKKVKGKRINELAKELGVESKTVLEKLRAEGLSSAAPNHMSVVSLGLAESIREWFSGGGVATAVEIAAPVKAKKVRPTSKKRAGEEDDAEQNDGDTASAGDEGSAPASQPEPSHVRAEAPSVDSERPASETGSPAVSVPEPAVPPAEALPVTETLVEPAPALRPAASGPAPAGVPAPAGESNRPAPRPTVTIGPTRGASAGPAQVIRRAVTPAPQLNASMLKPATMQGPKLIRVEKPDHVPTPRGPRRPLSEQQGPGYTTARPATGRGVKVFVDEDEEAAKKKAALKAKGTSLSGRRRGVDGRRGEAMEKLKEFTNADLLERIERMNNAGGYVRGVTHDMNKARARGTHAIAQTAAQKGEPVEVEEPITVKSLSAVLGIKSNDIVRKLFMQGVRDININSSLDRDTAATIALEYGVDLVIAVETTLEEELVEEFADREVNEANLQSRPAVVTILGHVDHGKTSLLDKIRSANVAAGESGGITQHTAAWQVVVGEGDNKKQVTFIDTPGHQAFTSMRARGADMTDVVVLVVAAVEGVMPQTIESINHARAAKKPIVIALNKIDRPDANPDMVLGQLAAQGLNPVEWGGDVEVIRTSAVTGQGIPELIEILDLQAQIMDLKADPDAPARGTVIEARRDLGLGSVATVLVQDGTLRVGDVVIAGNGYGRIRSLLNDRGEQIQEAGPSTPVIVSGLTAVPGAGDKLWTVEDLDRAREITEERQTLARQKELASRNTAATDVGTLYAQMKAGQIKTINLIIKADVQGSVETLVKTVTDYNTDEVRIRVIHSAVGAINESDVDLAAATKDVNESTVIVGFHVIADDAARTKAEHMHVEIRTYQVIYEIFDDLKKALSGMLEPEVREKLHGHVEIRKVIKVSKIGNIAGALVTDGHISRGSKIRLTRGGVVITEDLAIESLKRLKDDVKEVKAGLECGIKLAGYDDIKEGDVLEGYIRETFQRTL